MIADHRSNLGDVGKIETLLISQYVADHPRRSGNATISRQNLEGLGNSKIPDLLGFS